MTVEQLVAAGVKNNIFVYDADAKSGTFTPRLVQLLDGVVNYTLNDRSARLLVPAWTKVQCDGGFAMVAGGGFWGIPTEAMPAGAEAEFQKTGGAHPLGKHYLVAVVTEKGNVLLGGF